MSIFVSTGGLAKLPGNIVAERYLRKGIKNIELSGGVHTPTLVEDLLKIKKEANFQVHNYFPPPKNPFVLNLASADQKISNLSLKVKSLFSTFLIGVADLAIAIRFLFSSYIPILEI